MRQIDVHSRIRPHLITTVFKYINIHCICIAYLLGFVAVNDYDYKTKFLCTRVYFNDSALSSFKF